MSRQLSQLQSSQPRRNESDQQQTAPKTTGAQTRLIIRSRQWVVWILVSFQLLKPLCLAWRRGFSLPIENWGGGKKTLPTQKNVKAVESLTEALGKSGFTVLTDYRGLTVAQLQDLRAQLRAHNAELRVAKNTLTRLAARANNLDGLEETLVGPTAIMFAYEDPAQPAKVLRDFARSSRILEMKAAVLEGAIVPVERVEVIADLPSREELIAKVVGGFASPIHGLVNVLAGSPRSLLNVLQARANQLEAA